MDEGSWSSFLLKHKSGLHRDGIENVSSLFCFVVRECCQEIDGIYGRWLEGKGGG